jgi:hypothetical protein
MEMNKVIVGGWLIGLGQGHILLGSSGIS